MSDSSSNSASDSEGSDYSETQTSNDPSYKPCFFCGNLSNDCSPFVIRDIGKVDVCYTCDDILLNYMGETYPGPRFFLAKPLKKGSQLPRYVFDDVEEFKQWCEINDGEEDVYTFGMTRTPEFPNKDDWLKTGDEPYPFGDKIVYWYKDNRDCHDPLSWKHIYYTYTEADSDLINVRDGETAIEVDLPKFFKKIKSTYKKKQKSAGENRLDFIEKVQRELGL